MFDTCNYVGLRAAHYLEALWLLIRVVTTFIFMINLRWHVIICLVANNLENLKLK